ncbi:MAG: class I SAM-dependent methyltransferase, partial [Candidatus Omnitrophica bacterium]|nr:class I SAM-dependent methyltransferase [Candidatus Omnitrophota bacterium]
MHQKNWTRLDLGCGNNKISGATYLDIDPVAKPDILHDLNKFPYPIEDNSYDEIYARHIIEHLDDVVAFMKELYRILKPGGKVHLETPHFSSRVAYSEPQHTRFFSYFMFMSLINGLNFEIVDHRITFYKTFRASGISFLAN